MRGQDFASAKQIATTATAAVRGFSHRYNRRDNLLFYNELFDKRRRFRLILSHFCIVFAEILLAFGLLLCMSRFEVSVKQSRAISY